MATIQIKRGTESGIPTLAEGEPGFTTDTHKLFIGSSSGNKLIGPSSSVSDGDKGDVVVSSSGTVWTIDDRAVTLAKIQEFETGILLGRSTIGTGDLETIELEAPLTFSTSSLGISNGGITFAKMQNISSSRLLGRSTAGSGSVEQLTIGSGLSLSDGSLSAREVSFTTLYKWGF